MKLLKRLSAAALVCICMLAQTACSEDDGSGGVFKYDIPANPQSLDPQFTSDTTSDLLISNIFMGLLVANPDGSISTGVAEDYVVSDDGLVYTFKLRQDIYWIDCNEYEALCTAHDFVYGFQRLFDPETRASRASDYYCIKNSELVHRGHIPIVSEIGVKALGDFELEITLDYPNPQFPTLLTKSPAMPCNEDYFAKAQGKYGLEPEATPSNGAFYLKTWEFDPYTITDNNFIVLRRNYKTTELTQIFPSGLNFFIVDPTGFVDNFTKGTTDCIAVTDEEAALISGDYTVTDYSSISVGLIFNNTDPVLANTDFRRALASLVNREDIALPLAQYDVSAGVVPNEVTLLNKPYREYAQEDKLIKYDPTKAKSYYNAAESSLDKDLFIGARIILPDDTMNDAVAYIMQEWQKELGYYCKVEILPVDEYNKRLQSGDYEIAVVELTGGYNSPEAYLSSFSNDSSTNYSAYFSMEFERFMSKASRAVDLQESADYYVKAEQLILSEAAFVPLCFKNEYFFIDDEVRDIYYNPFTKSVDFSKAKTE